jgi:tripartite-type tricarboxylate transporter receptor subunit TctC
MRIFSNPVSLMHKLRSGLRRQRTSHRQGGFVRAVVATLLVALGCGGASAQNWPTEKAIRMVIPFTPGGVSDVLGRFWAKKLSTALGTPVVVENRPGAGTTIAASLVASAAPDGYTLYFTDVTTHAINATLYKKLPYKTDKDFTDIALVASAPLVFLVPTSLPVKTLPEFIALAKSKPGELNYGSSGNGTILHLAGETLKHRTGMNLVHVPYKGSSESIMGALGGQVSATFAPIPPALPQIKGGKLKALGVTSTTRNPALPDVPPIAETVPNFSIVLYSGILGPAGMPPGIVERINAEVSKAMKDADTKSLYATIGADPVDTSPAEFSQRFKALVEDMGQAVRQSGAVID